MKHLTPIRGLRGEILTPDSASIINEHDVAARMTLGKYQLTVTRGAVEVLRQGIDDLEEAHRAVAEALMRHPDCEVQLSQGDSVLISAAPARSS